MNKEQVVSVGKIKCDFCGNIYVDYPGVCMCSSHDFTPIQNDAYWCRQSAKSSDPHNHVSRNAMIAKMKNR